MHRYTYKKPNDDYGLHKVGLTIVGILMGICLMMGHGWISFCIGAAILTGIVYEWTKKWESYIEVSKNHMVLKNASVNAGLIKVEWNDVISVSRTMYKGRLITGFTRENFGTVSI